jgi:hypothetical protein
MRFRGLNGTPRMAAAVLMGAVFALLPTCLAAQQAAGGGVGGPFMTSDAVPLSRTIPDQEDVNEEMSRARMRLGPIRLLPSINVWNAGYDSNVFATSDNPVGDWTVSVNAGARFLVPFGSKFVLRADAFPQYTWYNELSERDEFGGRYAGSLYGFFNRMTMELAGGYFQQYQLYSTEVDTFVFQTSTNGLAKFDIELTSHLGVFGQGSYRDVRYEQVDGPPQQDIGVPLNDRIETGGRGGLRYRVSDTWVVGLAGEATFADFKITPELRNNTSTAALASIQINRPRFYVNLIGGYREGKGEDSDYFPRYSTGVGSFFLSFFPISWLELQGYGHREVTYSITVVNPYFFENRIGGKVNIQIGPRILLTGYGQVGPNNYPRGQPVEGQTNLVKRRDEAEQYGGGFSVILWRPIVLTGRAEHTSYDSNIPGDSRSYTRYTAMISFSGTFQR